MTRREKVAKRAAVELRSNYDLSCDLGQACADLEDDEIYAEARIFISEAARRLIDPNRFPNMIKMLVGQRDEARALAANFRDASERPGSGHVRLPWEKQ